MLLFEVWNIAFKTAVALAGYVVFYLDYFSKTLVQI